MEISIVHNFEKNRFITTINEHTAYVEYILTDDTLDIIHTRVPKPLEGRGIANELVKSAYEYAQLKNLKVIPSCSYVKTWIKRHPEYQNITL